MKIAFIPARKGSKRIENKNIKLLNGYPLIAYTICAARASYLFDKIIVSTDSQEIADTAWIYGAEVVRRPEKFAGDLSPDIEWIKYTLDNIDYKPKCCFILRPTSPFRTQHTIIRAWNEFRTSDAHSLRAVEKTTRSPYKMWMVTKNRKYIEPLYNFTLNINGIDLPSYTLPTQLLPEVFVQNASLEIFYTDNINKYNTHSGKKIQPFFTVGWEGFDLNDITDWWVAERLIEDGVATLPRIEIVIRPDNARHIFDDIEKKVVTRKNIIIRKAKDGTSLYK